MADSYFTIDRQAIYSFEVQRSKFICRLFPVTSAEEAQEYVRSISKEYSDATHNCYAYISNIAGTEAKFSDDGEPQGTAGQPMLEVLKKQGLVCVLAIVTRYFGGVKLGAGGLVSAYTKAVVGAITSADKVERRLSNIVAISFDYPLIDLVSKELSLFPTDVFLKEYTESVCFKAAVPKDLYSQITERLTDKTNGRISLNILGEEFRSFEPDEFF